MSQKKIKFIDLFSGCGGFSDGFLKSGKYEAVAHVDWEIEPIKVLRNRLIDKWNYSEKKSKKSAIHFDLQKHEELLYGNLSDESLEKYGNTNSENFLSKGLLGITGNQNIDLIIGGPPCQAYSIAGRAQDKDSMVNDYRNYLFESFLEVVKKIRPKLFVFENVPGILSAMPGGVNILEKIFISFKDHGYKILEPRFLKQAKFDLSKFGIPQKRERLFIIGLRSDSSHYLNNIYFDIREKESDKTVSLRDAIGKFPRFMPIKGDNEIVYEQKAGKSMPDHFPRYHNHRDVDIFSEWVKNGMNNLNTKEKLDYYKKKVGKDTNHPKYRSLDWEKPSSTMVAHLQKDGLLFIHPDHKQARSITVREAAAIQTFDNDFSFGKNIGHNYKMIGNAVPPKFGEVLGEVLYKYLK